MGKKTIKKKGNTADIIKYDCINYFINTQF